MKYISTLIILILFSFFSKAQNSKIVPKAFYKTILNSIAGRYAKVDVTMGYVKGTGGVNIGNPNKSEYGRFNSFSFSIYVLGRKDQQFGTITNITTESNNLNDFLIRFDWKNDRTDQGTITGEIQLFYSLSKNRYDTYFINNSNSVFKINWKTELDQIQKDSVNSLISLLFKKEFQNESEESKFNRLEEIKLEKEKELIYQKFLIEKRAYEVDKARMEMGLPPLNEKKREEERQKRFEQSQITENKISPVLGIPITIGDIMVAQYDFPNSMIWDDAMSVCSSLGEGWRLPTLDELKILFKNKNIISSITKGTYWSSTKNDSQSMWVLKFFYGNVDIATYYDYSKFSVRAVKTIKN